MKWISLLLNFFLFIITSCQVQESTTSGLVSGHVSVTNSFTVSVPANGTYKSTNALTFTATFPYVINVTGTPRLKLTIGASTVYATYVSGTGSKNLVFSYTIGASDNDSDGINVDALELNGGTLTFDPGTGVSTNCDVTTVTSTSLSGVKIDTTAPTISSVAPLIATAIYYHKDQDIYYKVTFSEPVYVIGVPSFTIQADSGSKTLNYVSGSGTNVLNFSFTVGAADYESSGGFHTGTNSSADSITLGSGITILDAAGNNATLSFNNLNTTTITFDGRKPYITNIQVPSAGTYIAAQNMDIVVTFDRTVDISGSPYIGITLESSTTAKQATFVSALGSNGVTTATFRYSPVPGDFDTNGITIANVISQNGGNIYSDNTTHGLYFPYLLTVPTTTEVLVGAVQPQVTSVTKNLDTTNPIWGTTSSPDNYWIIDQELLITLGFNTAMFVNQTSGAPTLTLNFSSGTKYATYYSGGDGQTSLVFRYVIESGDLDTDGTINIGNIVLNGGTITDSVNTNALLTMPSSANSLATTYVDGVRPTISSVTAPSNGTYSTVNSSSMQFTIVWSEAVRYTSSPVNLVVTIGSTPTNFTSSNSNTTTYTHRPGSLSTLNDNDGVVVTSPLTGAGVIKDLRGNSASNLTFSPPTTSSIFVDTTLPSISSTTPPAAGTYNTGDILNFSVTFSEAMTVTGTPRIAVNLDSGTAYANYTSGTGTNNLTFTYTVASLETDTNGISISSISLNGGTITDAGQNSPASYSLTATTTGILIDTTAPTISSSSSPDPGTYINGQSFDVDVTFSEAVTVTGIPTISVAADSGTINLIYTSGSGSNTLTFARTVAYPDYDLNGLGSANSISGTIKDLAGNTATALTFSSPIDFSAVNVDGIVPTISSHSITSGTGSFSSGDTLSMTVTFDDNVTVSGTPRITLSSVQTGDIHLDYNSGSGTSTLTFQYTLSGTEFDLNGLGTVSSISLNSGTIQDAQGNNATTTLNSTADFNSVYLAYSSIALWVDNSLNDKAPTPTGVTASGSFSTSTCGTSLCNVFSGTQSLAIDNPLNADTIFIVFRPSVSINNYDLFFTDITLDDDTSAYDLSTAVASTTNLDGVSSTTHDLNLTGGTLYKMRVSFSSTMGYFTSNSIIPTSFEGGIAEIIVINGPLSGTEQSAIMTYLNNKYP
jgi:hypothetical protein